MQDRAGGLWFSYSVLVALQATFSQLRAMAASSYFFGVCQELLLLSIAIERSFTYTHLV